MNWETALKLTIEAMPGASATSTDAPEASPAAAAQDHKI